MKGRVWDLFAISSLCHELFPTCTLQWSGHNRVQITCNTPSAYLLLTYHVQQVVYQVVWRDSSAIDYIWQSSHRICLGLILLAEQLTNKGGEETRVPGENPWWRASDKHKKRWFSVLPQCWGSLVYRLFAQSTLMLIHIRQILLYLSFTFHQEITQQRTKNNPLLFNQANVWFWRFRNTDWVTPFFSIEFAQQFINFGISRSAFWIASINNTFCHPTCISSTLTHILILVSKSWRHPIRLRHPATLIYSEQLPSVSGHPIQLVNTDTIMCPNKALCWATAYLGS